MLRFTSAHAISLICLAASAAIPLACATAVTPSSSEGTGAGGQGGASSSSSSSSTGGVGGGPCVTAADCAASSDACNVGTCINGACAKAPANELGACDDGKQCTMNDACHDGVCTGDLKPCPTSDTCHVGMCDVVTDKCSEVPGNDGAPCVDNDACTQTSTCSAGVCQPGQAVDCSFLDDVCSTGYCDHQIGCKVMAKNDGAACDDSLFCTVNDHCVGGQCKGDPKPCVPPGDPCKTGVCDEASNTCIIVNGNDGVACDDKNACTQSEACSSGKCVGGQPANPGGACDDHDGCTTVDTCNANGQCIGASPIGQCIDGDGCCAAGCTQATDTDCVPACCGDDLNPFAPDNNCFQGATWIAWEYKPSCGFNTTRIELHTDGPSVALLADSNGLPGATLFMGALGAADPQGWKGANVNPPIALTGGQLYWIVEAVGMCSIAGSGTLPTYWAAPTLNGPWDGPYNGHHWTSRVKGECPP